MPLSHINHFAFLVPGNYTDEDPARGLEDTLGLFELGERLGYGSAWVRQRHLERGVSSAATFLAAASQRTKTIGLGTAVIQLGYENPFRLAEDLATVDALSRGRLNAGVSAGPPPFAPLLGDLSSTPWTGSISAMPAPKGWRGRFPARRWRAKPWRAMRRARKFPACGPMPEG